MQTSRSANRTSLRAGGPPLPSGTEARAERHMDACDEWVRDLWPDLPAPSQWCRPLHPRTRENYSAALVRFFDWCEVKGLHPTQVTDAQAAIWVDELEPLTPRVVRLSNSTVNGLMTGVSSWYWWLIDRGHATANPLWGVARCAPPDEIATVRATREHKAMLLEQALRYRGGSAARNAAMLALVMVHGMRPGDVLGCELRQYTYREGRRALAPVAKRGSKRTRLLADLVVELIDEWLRQRARMEGREVGELEGLLFPTSTGRPVASSDFRRYVTVLTRRAGIREKLNPRSCRHGYVVDSRDLGFTLEEVGASVGHKDPQRTTVVYDRTALRARREPGITLGRALVEDHRMMREAAKLAHDEGEKT
ncbi:tyrosine-type recombinase/integrase [Streptomyces sp. NPDC015492]|uniref:tyrosine-type recombinase/integrase n=1 Tax=Streptomyces sp. NPDC015492 TaxID=3364958 RepID=UPI0036F9B2E4